MKQNTVEEFEFECSRCWQKVNLKSSIPVVKATTRPRSAGCNFDALSFLVNGQYLKDYQKILGTLGLDHVSFTQWSIHIVEWIAPFVKGSPTGACKKQELKQLDVEKKSSSTFHDAKIGKIIAYSHRPKNVSCLSSLANNA